MPFLIEPRLRDEEDYRRRFGEYLSTFLSEHGQVRADLFRRGDRLDVHISYPTELHPDTVSDRYAAELVEFAHSNGFDDNMQWYFPDTL